MSENGYVLLTGTANIPLADEIGKILKKKVHRTVSTFADGEKRIIIPENLRRRDVFIIQPTNTPVDSNIMELLLMIDAARRSSASEITVVVPYFGYSRQDRKDRARVPISASLVAGLIEFAGASRIVTLDLHAESEQGFTRSPWDNLFASYSLISVLKKNFQNKLIIASPDKNGVPKATFYAQKLNADGIAIVFKQRDLMKENVSEALDMVGDVQGEDVLIVDDMIDTAGTLCHAADFIMESGARSVSAAATHGLFSKPAIEKINASKIKKIFVTDTVKLSNEARNNPKIEVVTVAPLFAKAIECIHTGESISENLIPNSNRD